MAKPMTRQEWIRQAIKWDLPINYYPGWDTRGRPGEFNPNGVGIHHTGSDAGQGDNYDQFLFVTGRPDDNLPGPLCNASCDMDGDLHLGAIGRANHFGPGSSASLSAATSENWNGYVKEFAPGPDDIVGNGHFYGLEVKYDGGQPMTQKAYASATRFAAAICDFHGWSALAVFAHREWTRRKNDPGYCNMAQFRKDVQKLLDASKEKDWLDMATQAEVQTAVLGALITYGAALFKDESGTADTLWDEARADRELRTAQHNELVAAVNRLTDAVVAKS